MIFHPTPLEGAYVLELERRDDSRGFFARTWCEDQARAQGLDPHVAQCSISFNVLRGTLRGLHYQVAPHEEAKLIRCTTGAIFDVIIDLRPDSPTYKKYFDVVLSAENHKQLYVPKGFAHGFQTVADNTEVAYQISQRYRPEYSRGVRWNDPAFGIVWPEEPRSILERDRQYPDFSG